mgnify:CR=1 FL=1
MAGQVPGNAAVELGDAAGPFALGAQQLEVGEGLQCSGADRLGLGVVVCLMEGRQIGPIPAAGQGLDGAVADPAQALACKVSVAGV